MEINSEFYKTDIGKKVSSIIQMTSKSLIDRCYELIPADNIKTDLSMDWVSSMDRMLDNYNAKLLPWIPNEGKGTRIIVDAEDGFVIDAPLFHDEDGKAVEGDIYMTFDFSHDGFVRFNGIHY
jgi:hypothetical protein